MIQSDRASFSSALWSKLKKFLVVLLKVPPKGWLVKDVGTTLDSPAFEERKEPEFFSEFPTEIQLDRFVVP